MPAIEIINYTPKGRKGGIKKAKLQLKMKNQVEEGLKESRSVGEDISNIVNNVEIIRDVLIKKT